MCIEPQGGDLSNISQHQSPNKDATPAVAAAEVVKGCIRSKTSCKERSPSPTQNHVPGSFTATRSLPLHLTRSLPWTRFALDANFLSKRVRGDTRHVRARINDLNYIRGSRFSLLPCYVIWTSSLLDTLLEHGLTDTSCCRRPEASRLTVHIGTAEIFKSF